VTPDLSEVFLSIPRYFTRCSCGWKYCLHLFCQFNI